MRRNNSCLRNAIIHRQDRAQNGSAVGKAADSFTFTLTGPAIIKHGEAASAGASEHWDTARMPTETHAVSPSMVLQTKSTVSPK